MEDQPELETTRRNKWSHILTDPLQFIWAPIGLTILVVLGFVYAPLSYVVREMRFRSQMRRAGRYITANQVMDLVSSQNGTSLVEWPTIGWRISRAWWTREDVLKLCPVDLPQTPEIGHPFYPWAYHRYIDSDGGTALLFSVWNGRKKAARLAKSHSSLRMVDLCSGLLSLSNCQSCGGTSLRRMDGKCQHCGSLLDSENLPGVRQRNREEPA